MDAMFWQVTATILYLVGFVMAAVNMKLAMGATKQGDPPMVAHFLWIALWPVMSIMYWIAVRIVERKK